ncbi:WD40 repeat-like protein, partial [Rhizoctonia solani]
MFSRLFGSKSGTWAGLRVSLKTLRDTPAMFGPLVSAASILLECFDTVEAVARNQQDYEELAAELDVLTKSLLTTHKGAGLGSSTDCIAGIAIAIEREAREIENKTEHSAGRRVLMANADEQDLMRRYGRIQSLFRQLQANVGMSTWANTNELIMDARLAKLSAEKKATYNSLLSASTNRRTCTEGTRVSILSELERWVSAPDQKAVYWMSGMAGTGKTTIACTFAKWLETEKLLAASFFCTRTSADCRDVTRIVPTVAYQLARYCIPFQSALCDVLGRDPDLGTKDIRTQFERLLVDPLNQIKNDIPSNLVVVIDALDECDDQRGVEQVLDILFKHASQLPIRFFVTSRPEAEIYTTMTIHATSRAAIYLHDIEKSLVSADIQLYLKQELGSRIHELSTEVLEQLVDRSGVLFIYAATLVRYICFTASKVDPYQRLKSVLGLTAESGRENSPIDALYTAVLKLALEDRRLGGSEKETVRAVLRTVLFAQEPISLETIAALSKVDGTRQVEYALNALRSVLHHSEATNLVTTLHVSIPDFMAGESMLWGDEGPATVQHMQPAIVIHTRQPGQQHTGPNQDQDLVDTGVCMPLLAKSSSSDNGVGRHGDGAEGVPIRSAAVLDGGDVPAARAAVWNPRAVGHQAMDNGKYDDNSGAMGRQCHQLLHQLCRQPSIAIHSTYLHLMPAFLSSVKLGIYALLASDARAAGAEGKPDGPQRPSLSGNLEHGLASILGDVLGGWELSGSGMRRRNSEHTERIQWHGGCWAIPGSHRPDDRTIRVWDVCTGSPVAGPFQGHIHWVLLVLFSPDSKRIVSGSQDKTVCIWSAVDGTLLCGPLHGHIGSVRSVTYLPDGTLIASASFDNTIRLWCLDDGTPAALPLQGHTSYVYSVVFSPDGTLLVSGSEDMTVCVWRVSDGLAVTTPFQGHTSGVTLVAVLADGTLAVSGSDDCTVEPENSYTFGKLEIGQLYGLTESSQHVQMSGKAITWGFYCTVRVWRIANGLLAAGPFFGQSGRI